MLALKSHSKTLISDQLLHIHSQVSKCSNKNPGNVITLETIFFKVTEIILHKCFNSLFIDIENSEFFQIKKKAEAWRM